VYVTPVGDISGGDCSSIAPRRLLRGAGQPFWGPADVAPSDGIQTTPPPGPTGGHPTPTPGPTGGHPTPTPGPTGGHPTPTPGGSTGHHRVKRCHRVRRHHRMVLRCRRI
jgi:hypothetical protein